MVEMKAVFLGIFSIFVVAVSAVFNVPAAHEITVRLDDCDIVSGYQIPPNTPFAETYAGDELYQWNIPFIKAEAAWDIDAEGLGVKIAVLDSGLFREHPDIDYSQILPGVNCFTKDGDVGYDALHGTRVAGIIIASKNNLIGINGIADKVQIIPIKCFEYESTTLDIIVQAVYDAIDIYECDIINMSFGTYINSSALADAMSYAESKGVITIAAVGNKGGPEVYYPAGYDTVVGVGGLNTSGTVSVTSQKNISVTVSAPGEQIVSTAYPDIASKQYTTGGGTSFAAPQVTALAGIVKSIYPEITPAEFRQLLIDTADDAGAPGWDSGYGYGILNIERTLDKLLASILNDEIASDCYSVNVISADAAFSGASENSAVLSFNGSFEITNSTRVTKKMSVAAGVYSQTGQLMAFEYNNVPVKGFAEACLRHVRLDFSGNPEEQYIFKVFLWDSAESMLPLSPAVKTTLQPTKYTEE